MEKLRNNLPILSALLIFIGYLNYQFFYSNFDIEISSYLTTSELIFSFLPLTIPFLLIIGTLTFLSIGIGFAIEKKEENDELETDPETPLHAISRIPPAWNRMVKALRKKNKSALDWGLLPITILLFVMSVIVAIFMVAYIFIFVFISLSSDFSVISYTGTLVLGVFWIIFIFIRIDLSEKEGRSNWSRNLAYALLVTLSIGLLRISKNETATNILVGKPEYSAAIELTDSTITTDSTIVYVGQTSNYLFLRNRKTRDNIILNMGSIRRYSLNKIKSDKRKDD